MNYHAPTKSFVVTTESLEGAAMLLRLAIKKIREQASLPLEPHNTDVVMGAAQFAEQWIIDAARYVGIDLGATMPGQLDVRDAP